MAPKSVKSKKVVAQPDKSTTQIYDPGNPIEAKTVDTEKELTVGVEQPFVFQVMLDLQDQGLKVLDPQSGRQFHALINLPAFGLTREKTKDSNGHAFGLVPNHLKGKPSTKVADILIDEKQAPYNIEAVLFIHGKATWALEAVADYQWILMVTDSIDLEDYLKLILPVVQNYQVSLVATSLLESIEKGVRIKPSSILPGDGTAATAISRELPLSEEEPYQEQ
jgi:hypothetical protein